MPKVRTQTASRRAAQERSRHGGRYTAPLPRSAKQSPRWVGVLLLALLIAGVLLILVNYLGVLPGGASNWYLIGGIILILAGFGVATQYK